MTDVITEAPTPTTSTAHPVRDRLAAVAVTVVVTLAVWALGRLAGADYVLRDPAGDVVIDAVATTVVTLVVALLGWGVLAALERLTRRGAAIWTALAVAVTVASMVPIFLVDAGAGTRTALYFVHLAVLVLVPGMLRVRR